MDSVGVLCVLDANENNVLYRAGNRSMRPKQELEKADHPSCMLSKAASWCEGAARRTELHMYLDPGLA